MKVGTIKETKIEEYRVGLTPSGVRALAHASHNVFVEQGAGEGSGFGDSQYEDAGATVCPSAGAGAAAVDPLGQGKETLGPEVSLRRGGLVASTFLYPAPLPAGTRARPSPRARSLRH